MHAPIESCRVRSEYVPWLTPYIIQEMNHHDSLKKKAVLSKSDTYFSAYKTQRNRVNYLVKQAKENFCQESNRCNPKEMWKNINLIIGRNSRASKRTTISSLNFKNTKVTKVQDIAEALNTFFTEIGTNLSSNLSSSNKQFSDYVAPVSSSFNFTSITNDNVSNTLSQVKCSKAVGLDNKSAKLLKDASDVIASYLTNIFNI